MISAGCASSIELEILCHLASSMLTLCTWFLVGHSYNLQQFDTVL